MQPVPLRVVIAEDQVLLREGIVRLLDEAGFDVVGQAADADDLIRKVGAHRPDVAIIDIQMPPTNTDDGLRAAMHVRATQPDVGVLVLSQFVEEAYVLDLIGGDAAGVGYLLKDRVADVAAFTDAILRVSRGGSALDPEVVAQLMVPRQADDRLHSLTPREREVLAAMAEGRTNMGVATLLSISEGATEKHISNIFGKLELPDSENDHRRVLAVLTYLGS